ncbi:glycerophosphodiester phosphodiesterase family protein [Brevibacillus borstelensis]|jgi:glycerophosphoryl diester phosphodiesterase|uniref:Glycerophosphoryl diester phosphodiesterase n=1 Tax=Brevibacillus borstelensis AK1 TaxID=1300222 RepID=M8E9E9_9BACL|nr:glycerophosphodiester phosphodiesterase family protein [Brevibacillus borstelensis]EMT52085.1 glycerophosphoryl diester phosphodiesterase [Brevibacillus borstelensis AK1]MBE5396032.1 glycerophosphodiester phosphodiesterase [Brevibacillus borstelensis]
MKKLKKMLKNKFVLCLLVLAAFVYINNSSLFTKASNEAPLLLAHRGMAQTFHMEGITGETCTAERIYEPEHPFLENTIPSMEAAFQAGADIVEFDVQPTRDGKFAVFHDWTLGCRTNGQGVTREHTLEELKRLDIGYGYTADQGKTYPFRGKGIGLMPSLEEVLNHFPEQSFLIHVKSNDPTEGEQLAAFLSGLPASQLERLTVYGGDEPIAALKEGLPSVRVMSKATMKSCLIPYMAAGWTGYVPAACEHTQLHIPEKIGPWLWGWPTRFLERMDNAHTRVIVVGGDGSDFSTGFDTPEDVKRLPSGYTGGIWTNRIDRIGPLYQQK